MANKLDQFFRENLDQVEIAPSAEGWRYVQDQLSTKKGNKTGLIWKVAAVVTVLVAATVALWNVPEGSKQQWISAVDHPVVDDGMTWSFDIPRHHVAHEAANEKANKPQRLISKQNSQSHPSANQMVREEIPTLRVAALNEPKIEVELDLQDVAIPKEQPEEEATYIKITYIASTASKKAVRDDDSEGRLTKVLSAAKEVHTLELLADIREAKDNLFRRNN